MAGCWKLVSGASCGHLDNPSPSRPSKWRAGRNNNSSDVGSCRDSSSYAAAIKPEPEYAPAFEIVKVNYPAY